MVYSSVYSGVLKLPWVAEDFLFYCCPDCDIRTKVKVEFVKHAQAHVSGDGDENIAENEQESKETELSDAMVVIDDITPNVQDDDLDPNASMECWQCLKNFPGVVDLRDHMFKEHGHRCLFKCPHCEVKCKKMATLSIHLGKVHAKGVLATVDFKKSRVPKTNIEEGPYRECWECTDKKVYSHRELSNHMIYVHGHRMTLQCSKCPRTFRRQKILAAHEEKHSTEQSQENSAENKEASEMTEPAEKGDEPIRNKKHVVKQNEMAKIDNKCWVCQDMTVDIVDLRRHMSKAHGHVNIYKCPHCAVHKGFWHSGEFLNYHLAKKHGKGPLASDIPQIKRGPRKKKPDDKQADGKPDETSTENGNDKSNEISENTCVEKPEGILELSVPVPNSAPAPVPAPVPAPDPTVVE